MIVDKSYKAFEAKLALKSYVSNCLRSKGINLSVKLLPILGAILHSFRSFAKGTDATDYNTLVK